MIFEEFKLSSPLVLYIDRVFYFKDYVGEHNIERVVPTGNIFLLFEFDNFERNTFDDRLTPNGTYRQSWVSGMHQKHLNISVHQHSEMLAVQFKPTGAFPFFKIPVHQINNSVTSSVIYFGNNILQVRSNIMNEENISEKFKIIEHWLLKIYDQQKTPPDEIIHIVTNMQASPFSKHNELIKDYSKTKKNLIDQFKKYCGLTPKNLHRIFRFNTILTTIHQKQEIVWSDIVYETGYTDQSHFIKEFQEFSGFNPTKYIKNNYHHQEPNFFPLNDRG